MPVGLGIYWAWVHRDWSSATKTVGLAAAMGGALVGAWLGFNATEGLLALIAVIAGAAVGANLALIVLGMTWEWRIGSRLAREAEMTSGAGQIGVGRTVSSPRTEP